MEKRKRRSCWGNPLPSPWKRQSRIVSCLLEYFCFPGLPEWIDLEVIVPVSATVVVVCVGILVVCVAVSRRKQPPLMDPGLRMERKSPWRITNQHWTKHQDENMSSCHYAIGWNTSRLSWLSDKPVRGITLLHPQSSRVYSKTSKSQKQKLDFFTYFCHWKW